MNGGDVDITALLARWRNGDRDAENALMNAVYPLLRELAQMRLRRAGGNPTLSATELVNEAYARLARGDGVDYQNRTHFFAVAARAIRNFVVDYLRARGSEKRGGGLPFVELDKADETPADDLIDLRTDWLAVHEALNRLELVDRECARMVELKFFSGLTTEEIAEASGVSRATVVRNWRFAKAWLLDQLASRDRDA
ncbi:ECF-type sigma factor [Tahibacter caeni]|uniref:ECF-type sigma factor n=1 Tax=Tahibacter caeni TaxID=1453545 RepID=UPI002148DBF1